MKNPLETKLYYSISEVADITDLQPYTLRAWEKEFSCLRPRRMGGKNRAYRERDIGIVLLIKYLLYEARYTTQGVKQRLKNEPELIQGVTSNIPAVQKVIQREEGAGQAMTQLVRELQEDADGPEQENDLEKQMQMELSASTVDENAFKEMLEDARRELKEILKLLT